MPVRGVLFCAFTRAEDFAYSVHGAVCFIFFYTKQKGTRIPSPVSGTDNSLQKLPDSSATSCFIAFISKLLEYITEFKRLQEFL
jgi:hypothetical protein